MKKQVITGWAYPCDEPSYFCGEIILRATKLKRTLMRRYSDFCDCEKKCKPIRVSVTVEPVEENHENK